MHKLLYFALINLQLVIGQLAVNRTPVIGQLHEPIILSEGFVSGDCFERNFKAILQAILHILIMIFKKEY